MREPKSGYGGTNDRPTKTVRRVGFDLNFHVPKSVSVVYGLTGDPAVLAAFKAAVRETLRELESDTRTRVRIGGQDETRTTGNLANSLFVHATSRPVDGVPDPHLHAHAFTFNLTFDAIENRWKAVELGEVYKNAPYYEAVFHARYARKLVELGFDVCPTVNGWEISGIPKSVLKTFSRRTERIESLADELGVTNPEEKSTLGAKTRERKQLKFTIKELLTIWKAKLSADVPDRYGHLTHGYVVTSHSSQGKTVDRVLVAQSSESFVASDRQQFYVSASRARESVTVYTDNKSGLRRAIERSEPTISATELSQANPPERVWRAWLARRVRWLRRQLGQTTESDHRVRTREILAGSER